MGCRGGATRTVKGSVDLAGWEAGCETAGWGDTDAELSAGMGVGVLAGVLAGGLAIGLELCNEPSREQLSELILNPTIEPASPICFTIRLTTQLSLRRRKCLISQKSIGF